MAIDVKYKINNTESPLYVRLNLSHPHLVYDQIIIDNYGFSGCSKNEVAQLIPSFLGQVLNSDLLKVRTLSKTRIIDKESLIGILRDVEIAVNEIDNSPTYASELRIAIYNLRYVINPEGIDRYKLPKSLQLNIRS